MSFAECRSDENRIVLFRTDSEYLVLSYSGLSGSLDDKKAEIKSHFQKFIDVCVPLAELTDDTVEKRQDPGREDFFWADGCLVSRAHVIEDASWGDKKFTISVRKTTQNPR